MDTLKSEGNVHVHLKNVRAEKIVDPEFGFEFTNVSMVYRKVEKCFQCPNNFTTPKTFYANVYANGDIKLTQELLKGTSKWYEPFIFDDPSLNNTGLTYMVARLPQTMTVIASYKNNTLDAICDSFFCYPSVREGETSFFNLSLISFLFDALNTIVFVLNVRQSYDDSNTEFVLVFTRLALSFFILSYSGRTQALRFLGIRRVAQWKL